MENLVKKNKIVGVIGSSADYFSINNVFIELAGSKKSIKKINDALRLVNLNPNILKKSLLEVSSGEKDKVLLAKELLNNNKNIYINNITHLDSKSKKNLIKLLKLMKLRYNKSVVIKTEDTDFLLEVCDYIYIINNDIIYEGDKFDILTNIKLLEKCDIKIPNLIKFSNLVKEKTNINIGYRDDINDLIKDVYRYAEKEVL